MNKSTYPKSPDNIPDNFTKLSNSYKFKAGLAIVSIVLFFLLYFSLVTVLGYTVKYAFMYDMGSVNKITILLKVGAIAGAVMLFVFTVKFIFKLKNPKPENRIKLDKLEHPDLINFINNICEETGAPKPKNIYLDPDVNAYVAYSNMWLSLFFPVKKDLTIGSGLMSGLNLSEFKAVVSHEFGHFAQGSMKIGSYIHSANTIIHGMIFERDKWDNTLDQWRSADLRLSAAAWAITPVIWIIRQSLRLFYILLNVMYSSLSREMEFNADKVAVSTSGSEAIVSGLWKLDSALEKWNLTVQNAYHAALKNIYIKNMYKHMLLSVDRAAPAQSQLIESLVSHPEGGRLYFTVSENSKAGMYASHPPNDQRELNAKTPFVPCNEDSRSPWILFSNADQLQIDLTVLVYDKYLNKKPDNFCSEAEFELFVKAESLGLDLMKEYHDTFKDRFFIIPELIKLMPLMPSSKIDALANIEKLKIEIIELMKPVKAIGLLIEKAHQIASGTSKEKTLFYDGVTYKKKEIEEGFKKLMSDREIIFDSKFKDWDLQFCASHLKLAENTNFIGELRKMYVQHSVLVSLFKVILNKKDGIYTELNNLQSKGDVEVQEVINLQTFVLSEMDLLNIELDNLNTIDFVELPNIGSIEELKNAVVENGAFHKGKGKIFENGEFDAIINSIEGAVVNCQRLDQKTIGKILMMHSQIVECQSINGE